MIYFGQVVLGQIGYDLLRFCIKFELGIVLQQQVVVDIGYKVGSL